MWFALEGLLYDTMDQIGRFLKTHHSVLPAIQPTLNVVVPMVEVQDASNS
jgi:hypothetical protein